MLSSAFFSKLWMSPFGGLLCLLSLLGCSRDKSPDAPVSDPYVLAFRGADLSFLPAVRWSGLPLQNAAQQTNDALHILADAGMNVVRLRLWYQPSQSSAQWHEMLQLKEQIKARGLKLLLSVHYSDTWADPAAQLPPSAWQNLNLPALADSVEAYTTRIMLAFEPDYIQIGNEINGGFLWPIGSSADTTAFHHLLRAGIRAVRAARPQTQIMLHFAGYEGASGFFDQRQQLDYDLIGLSYYPIWHGKSLDSLGLALAALKQQTSKGVVVVETSYPFTLAWNDETHNVVGQLDQLLPAYQASPMGQKQYLYELTNTVMAAGGLGWCYWGAEWVSFGNSGGWQGSSWENQALWDFDGRLLPAANAYGIQE